MTVLTLVQQQNFSPSHAHFIYSMLNGIIHDLFNELDCVYLWLHVDMDAVENGILAQTKQTDQ